MEDLHNIILFSWFLWQKIFDLLCFEAQTDPPYLQQDHPFMKGITSAAVGGGGNYQRPWHTRARSKQRLKNEHRKCLGCAAVKCIYLCVRLHIHSSQHSHHHVASGSGRAICIDKEMSACIIWKCVIVFIHTQTQRCMWNLYPAPREPALWGNVCQTGGNCDASPQSNKRMFNVHSCSECIKLCLRAAGV